MKATLIDRRAIPLSELKPGEIAFCYERVGATRQQKMLIYAKVWIAIEGKNQARLIELSDLAEQYLDKVDERTMVVKLEENQSVELRSWRAGDV